MNSLDHLRIATPCPIGWDQMKGSDRVRFCDLCHLNVYNISELSATEAHELISRANGERVCARLFRRADGTVLTRDCPVGVRAFRRRVGRMVGAVFTSILSICSLTPAQSQSKKSQADKDVLEFKIKRTAAAEQSFIGAITDQAGMFVPGAKVVLVSETGNAKYEALTGDDGVFKFQGLEAGQYSVAIERSGFKKLSLKDLKINPGETANVEIVLNGEITVLIGVVAETPLIENNMGTTIISGEMIRKLPIQH